MFTALVRPALRPAALKNQIQLLPIPSRVRDWILRYNTAVILDFNIQFRVWNYLRSKLEDLRKSV
jgi:hypothetical protein